VTTIDTTIDHHGYRIANLLRVDRERVQMNTDYCSTWSVGLALYPGGDGMRKLARYLWQCRDFPNFHTVVRIGKGTFERVYADNDLWSLAAETKRFELHRLEDETGISGVGHVADGIEFADGTCALRWRSENKSTAVYASRADVEAIHGHGGKTVLAWLDS
jgi:hypothetical protein